MATKPTPQAFSDKPRPLIQLTPVESNKITAIGYAPELKTLAVTFKYGKALYHYPNVEPAVHAAFMAAESKGKFFGAHLQTLPFEKFHLPEGATA